jgi:2-hydroxy-3-oxopropionate reductase
MPERVGFIGLGLMGRPMALNLIRKGVPVTVFNRSRPAVDALVREGAIGADSVADVARQSTVAITMLPDGPDVEAVLDGPDGFFRHAAPGSLAIDMSTIAPRAAMALYERALQHGHRFLDAPVSGGPPGAEAATLSIMVGGDAADVGRAQPLFEALGRTITHCGPAGFGQFVKACNQVLLAGILESIAEAFVFAEAAGVNPDIMIRVLQAGAGHTRVMEVRGPRVAAGDFTPGFKAAHHLKDLHIVLDEAGRRGVRLNRTQAVRDMLAALVARGQAGVDNSAIYLIVKEQSTRTSTV